MIEELRRKGFNKVVVALSGGADSVAATFALHQAGLQILALHCNFHLRGSESNRDMEFVRNFCARLDIPLEIKEFDVDEYVSAHKGCSVEMACRNLRHQWFDEKLKETGYDRIVTGHNADDNIETFFLNALRGSGTRGLKGMTEDTGKIWRPLLAFHRQEILEFLKENNLNYVVDSTNLTSDYRRNFLRNKVIPLLREEWKGFDAALDKTLGNLKTENLLVEDAIARSMPERGEPLSVSTITASPAPLLVIKRFIDPLEPYITTPEEILKAIKANKPHIRRWKLKKGDAYLRNGRLFIEICHSESGS